METIKLTDYNYTSSIVLRYIIIKEHPKMNHSIPAGCWFKLTYGVKHFTVAKGKVILKRKVGGCFSIYWISIGMHATTWDTYLQTT